MGNLAPRRMAISQAGKDERMTKLNIGDVVTVDDSSTEGTIESFDEEGGPILDNDADKRCGWHPSRVHLVRRASESQREGGFAVGQRVRLLRTTKDGRAKAGCAYVVGYVAGDSHQLLSDTGLSVAGGVMTVDLEPADPAPAPPSDQMFRDVQIITDPTLRPNEVKLLNHAGEEVGRFTVPTEPPQPAPMTRAARVLQGMERDPYLTDWSNENIRWRTDANPRNEAARLRMAKMQLDDELTYDQTRWRKLVLAKVPVGRR